jgi:DnaJ-class molecular chaperone
LFSNFNRRKFNFVIIYYRCPKCGGKGKVTAKVCHECKGDKIVKGLEELSVYIEKGMNNGHEIV